MPPSDYERRQLTSSKSVGSVAEPKIPSSSQNVLSVIVYSASVNGWLDIQRAVKVEANDSNDQGDHVNDSLLSPRTLHEEDDSGVVTV